MRTYGDSLLRELTIDILTELAGKHNMTMVVHTLPFAISNAFYENLLSHFDLEDLCIPLRSLAKGSKSYAVKRGDVLEAYVAAIEKDISRFGQGSREIYDWLFKVLALRLRSGLRTCTGTTKNWSLGNVNPLVVQTVLKTDEDLCKEVDAESGIEGCFGPGDQNAVVRTAELPEHSIQATLIACQTKPRNDTAGGQRIWWDNWKAEQPISISNLVRQSPRDRPEFATQLHLHGFRQTIFAKMKATLLRVCATHAKRQQIPAFWTEMKSFFDVRLKKINEVEPTQLNLLYYYRV